MYDDTPEGTHNVLGNLPNTAKALAYGGVAAKVMTLPRVGVSLAQIGEVSKTGVSDLGTIKKFIRDNNLQTSFNARSDILRGRGLSDRVIKKLQSANMPGYHQPSDIIVGVKRGLGTVSKDVIMHELGHAKDFSTYKGLKIAGGLGRSRLGKLVFGAGSVAALNDSDYREYAPSLAAIPGALTMREEVMANLHAYNGIKSSKGVDLARKFLKRTGGLNMAYYGLGAASPVLAMYIARNKLNEPK